MLSRKRVTEVLLGLVVSCMAMTLASCAAAKSPVSGGQAFTNFARTARQDYWALDKAVELAAQRKYDEAAAILEPLGNRFESVRDIRRAAESIFWLGYCREKQGRSAEAADCYKRIIAKYPQTEVSGMAQDRLDGLLGPREN